MTSLRVKQIKNRLLKLIEPHLDLHDIKADDKDRETKVLTRCLAAFAVYSQTACSEKEAASSVWDSSDDNGIDAAFHDVSDSRVVIVQSKWIHAGIGEPEAKDIATFANGVRDIVEQENGNFAGRLQPKITEIVHLVLISTGSSEIAKHGTIALDRVINELNGSDQEALLQLKR